MGKIVMPKNSALLNEIESVLQIYYEARTWIPNDEYKAKLKEMIGDDQYSSSYTKKAQITSYFGFTIWEDIHNPQSRRRITESGKQMYEAINANNTNQVQAVLMNALETVKFGRNNYGCPDSNSDVEPPALYIRAILDLGYLTYREFAFMLWKLEDLGANYTDTLAELRTLRSSGTVELDEEANKYADCKPIMILARWGFLSEDESDTTGGKHIIIVPEVLGKYETRLRNLKIYNIDMDCDDPIVDDEANGTSESYSQDQNEEHRHDTGCNVLLYGVPGAGKSWTIEHEYCDNEDCMERLVFHPDYMYSDFVGQILPVVKDDDKVRYEFMPGPFTKLLKRAYSNPDKSYYLIVEEINRGNAPAIFGEIFQLLDRKDENEFDKAGKLLYKKGTSEYGITNANIARIVYGNEEQKVRIPANMSILGTMNTSDQNVFTLDTAFQRRWIMRMIPNSFVNHKFADMPILDTEVSWKQFCEAINDEILRRNNITSSEDKRIGAYFISAADLEMKAVTDGMSEKDRIQVEHNNNRFAEKVLKYLWDDAFKFSHQDTFNTRQFGSLEKVIAGFMDPIKTKKERFRVFNENLRKMILDGIETESSEFSDDSKNSQES
ncbi:MAG: AAA family ATPase [Erysipelotrichaceae bacterium]